MGTSVWETIPTSIQTIVGVAAIMGVGWTWFVRPRMVALLAEAVAQGKKETRDELRGEMAKLRDELRGEIAALGDQLHGEMATTRKELAAAITQNHGGIEANRDSIFANREVMSDVRIETRDLLLAMQRENQEAHAAIGDRIAAESKELRTRIEELSTNSARLAGAVDVLTSIWQAGDPRGRIRTS